MSHRVTSSWYSLLYDKLQSSVKRGQLSWTSVMTLLWNNLFLTPQRSQDQFDLIKTFYLIEILLFFISIFIHWNISAQGNKIGRNDGIKLKSNFLEIDRLSEKWDFLIAQWKLEPDYSIESYSAFNFDCRFDRKELKEI